MWYSAHIVAINRRGRGRGRRQHYDLQYADGEKELMVPSRRIRAQQFSSGDIVMVNSGGKGEWFECTVQGVEDGSYTVRYESDKIRWVTDLPIKGRDGVKNNQPLSVYGLVGWRIYQRNKDNIILRRPALPPCPRGCAVTPRSINTKMRAAQVAKHVPIALITY